MPAPAGVETARETRALPGPRRRPEPPRRSRPMALLRAMRPRQWAKNVLVLAAPGTAGVLGQWPATLQVGLAVVAFCLVASGGYLLNDARDAPADRRHPRKRKRPVAAGELPVRAALVAGTALLLGGLGLAFAVRPLLGLTAAGYVALTALYTFRLRHEAVLDIVAVASFFLLRAVAGGAATGVPLSRWFLIVAAFGSLFVVAGKRAGERAELGEVGAHGETHTRATLAEYSDEYLRQVRTVSFGVAMTAYCVWAFHQSDIGRGYWPELSIVPFTVFMLRYGLLVDRGGGGAPEDLVLGDRGLQVAAVAWLVLVAIGVHVHP